MLRDQGVGKVLSVLMYGLLAAGVIQAGMAMYVIAFGPGVRMANVLGMITSGAGSMGIAWLVLRAIGGKSSRRYVSWTVVGLIVAGLVLQIRDRGSVQRRVQGLVEECLESESRQACQKAREACEACGDLLIEAPEDCDRIDDEWPRRGE